MRPRIARHVRPRKSGSDISLGNIPGRGPSSTSQVAQISWTKLGEGTILWPVPHALGPQLPLPNWLAHCSTSAAPFNRLMSYKRDVNASLMRPSGYVEATPKVPPECRDAPYAPVHFGECWSLGYAGYSRECGLFMPVAKGSIRREVRTLVLFVSRLAKAIGLPPPAGVGLGWGPPTCERNPWHAHVAPVTQR